MAARPLVQVYNANGDVVDQVRLPQVFLTSIRDDIVQYVHTNLRKNARQAYGVAKWAGHQTSAESWGTGRAVARIPRVPGGGTHRAGQGAFGNMCRGGRMFSPNRIWRKWHRKVNVNQKRYAVASAIAASAVPALVMARGHRISQVPEIPLVVANEAVEGLGKTKKAHALLKKISANEDVERVENTLVHRAGKGKLRNRPYKERVGPLIIHGSSKNSSVAPAFRNLPGVEIASVTRLNLLRLAPGGHLGRFVIWTRSAFEQLDKVWGGFNRNSTLKKNYRLPRPIIANPDIARVLRADEVLSNIRPVKTIVKRRNWVNPLTNPRRMALLNPASEGQRRNAAKLSEAGNKRNKAAAEARSKKVIKPHQKSTAAAGKGPTAVAKKRSAALRKFMFQQ